MQGLCLCTSSFPGCVSETQEEHIPPATKQEKKICITLAEHLTANRAATLFDKSPSFTHEAVSKKHHIFLTKPLTEGLSCP